MAGRGFQIQEDLLPHFYGWFVSPGSRVKSQNKKSEVKKTKRAANLRKEKEIFCNRKCSLKNLLSNLLR